MISENDQNPFLETFISMKNDAECNTKTPAFPVDRFHEVVQILTEMTSNSDKKKKASGTLSNVNLQKIEAQIWNQRPLFNWRLL